MQDLVDATRAQRVAARALLDDRQDRVVHRLERLRDQGRTDRPRRVATAEHEQAAAPAQRHGRRGQQVAREVDDVAQVVAMPDAGHRMGCDPLRVVGRQARRPAHAGVQPGVLRQPDGAHTLDRVGLDQARCLAVGAGGPEVGTRPDVERGVRPGRLRQVLDRGAEAAVPLDEQHVAGPQTGTQLREVGRHRGGVHMALPRQPLREAVGEALPHRAGGHRRHQPPPPVRADTGTRPDRDAGTASASQPLERHDIAGSPM